MLKQKWRLLKAQWERNEGFQKIRTQKMKADKKRICEGMSLSLIQTAVVAGQRG